MAAGEDQPQPVVHDRAHRIGAVERCVRIDRRELLLDQRLPSEELRLLRQDPPAPDPIDRPVASSRRDPGSGVARHAPSRPRLEGSDERVLDGFFGKVEVTEDADQGGHRPSLLLAEQAIDDGVGILGTDGQGRNRTWWSACAAIVGRQPAAPAFSASASAIA